MAADPEEMQGELVDLGDEPEVDYEDTEDGGVNVSLPDEMPPVDQGEFYDNLVYDIPENVLDSMALDLLDKIDEDKKARKRRDDQYAEGIRRTGLGQDAPGGGQFQGASKTVHPMITTAAVEFNARTMKELFPPGGPCKTYLPGTVTKARWEKAERLRRFYNWQLTQQMPEFRPEHEKVLTQSSIGGVEYARYNWDATLRRPATCSVPLDKLIIPYAATSFYTAERITYVDDITEFEYNKRVRDGMYRDVDIAPPSMAPKRSKPQEARDKVEGKDPDVLNQDGVRRTFEVNTWLEDIEQYVGAPGRAKIAPYLVYIDEDSRKILAVVRNWEENDPKLERMHWIVEWGFVPWEGAYPIGLVHMIGSLSAAATGALRALLDSAHVNNFPTAARLKGAQVGGQSKQVQPTEIVEVDGGVGAEDIRKLMMPFPFNPPSATLYQLLQFLVEAGNDVVRTAFEKFSDNNPNAPVGTTYAYIEQGLVVVSSIIGRMHQSMGMTLRVLHRINKMYITDDEIKDETGEVLAYRRDFTGPSDVVPISDPATPSDAHRFAQVQSIVQRADMHPELYDTHAVEELFLERMRVPDAKKLLKSVPEPQEMNAANENAAAVMGRPITAFPEQNHLAHLQVHIDFMQNPVLGMLPIIAPTFLPVMLGHLKEHISLWYVNRVYERLNAMMGKDVTEYMKIKNPAVKRELDANIAVVSQDIMQKDMQSFQALPGIVQQAQAMLQKFQPQIQDPNAQVQAQRNQIQAQKNQDDADIRRQELQQKMQDMKLRVVEGQTKTQADVQRDAMKQENENRRAEQAEQGDTIRTQMKTASQERINDQDNMTALTIARAEIESGEKVAQTTGKDSSPGK
jgi:hypothetical protein